MTNQVMRSGVIHLRVTPTVLPLWHTCARTTTHIYASTHPHAFKDGKLKSFCVLRMRSNERRTRLKRAMRFGFKT